MHDHVHNEALLEIIILKAFEHTIASTSNENANNSRTQTKILHNTKHACALTQRAHDKVKELALSVRSSSHDDKFHSNM